MKAREREQMTKLSEAIDRGRKRWEADHGKCSMCRIDKPSPNGWHVHGGKYHRCANTEACSLCSGCLPAGEICQACGRKNIHSIER